MKMSLLGNYFVCYKVHNLCVMNNSQEEDKPSTGEHTIDDLFIYNMVKTDKRSMSLVVT